jgi:hypothetical protein
MMPARDVLRNSAKDSRKRWTHGAFTRVEGEAAVAVGFVRNHDSVDECWVSLPNLLSM